MPQIIVDIPAYSPGEGLKADWDDGFEILVQVTEGEVTIRANNAGLRSLARLVLQLAQEDVSDASHWHLDDFNSLNEGSAPLTLTRLD